MQKKQYFANLFDHVKNNVKNTWKVINSVLGRKKGKQLFKLRINGEDIKDEVKIADEFNNYFSNVASNLVKKIPNDKIRKNYKDYLPPRTKSSLFFKSTNPAEILKLLKALPPKKVPDGMAYHKKLSRVVL